MSLPLPGLRVSVAAGMITVEYGYSREANDAVKSCGFRWAGGPRWQRRMGDRQALIQQLDAAGLVGVADALRALADDVPTTALRVASTSETSEAAGGALRPGPPAAGRRLDLFADVETDVGAGGARVDDSDDLSARVRDDASDAWTVGDFLDRANAVVQRGFPGTVTLTGAASNLERSLDQLRPWGLFFTLADTEAREGRRAAVSVRASRAAWTAAAAALRAAGVEPVDDLPLKIRGRVEVGRTRGELQVVLVSIDPAWSLGVFALRREEVLRQIAAEGLARRNLDLPIPQVPVRIALVTADGSDASRDVLSKLRTSPWGFHVELFPVNVQGAQLEATVLRALARVAAEAEHWDVCVLARGGGSRAELADWDNLAVARAVAMLPVKVLVGIGHERDQSALDAIAWSRRTPTDAAVALMEQMELAWGRVDDLRIRLAAAARGTCTREADALEADRRRVAALLRAAARTASRRMDEAGARVRRAARSRLGRADEQVAERAVARLRRAGSRRAREQGDREASARARLRRTGGRIDRERARVDGALAARLERVPLRVDAEGVRLDAADRMLRLADPLRPLRLGFAFVERVDGGRLRIGERPAKGDALRLRLVDALVDVRVDGVTERDPGPPPPDATTPPARPSSRRTS